MLWEDAHVITPESVTSTNENMVEKSKGLGKFDVIVKEFCEIITQAKKEKREIAKLIQTTFEDIERAEKEASKVFENQSKKIVKKRSSDILQIDSKDTKPLILMANEWNFLLENFSTSLTDLHQKLWQYLHSNAVPQIKLLCKGLTTEEKNWKEDAVKAEKEIRLASEEVEKIRQEEQKVYKSLKQVKEDIKKNENDATTLEKYMNLQVSLNGQLFEKQNCLDLANAKYKEVIENNMKNIRMQVTCWKEINQQKQEQLIECIIGVMTYCLEYWEQKIALSTQYYLKAKTTSFDTVQSTILNQLNIQAPYSIKNDIKASCPTTPIQIPEEAKELIPIDIMEEIKVTSPEVSTPGCSGGKQSYLSEKKKKLFPMTPVPKLSQEKRKLIDEPNQINLTSPSNGSWLFKKFKVSENLIESFACALSWKILLQGRIYITPSKICFYSHFNNSTLFGGDTKLIIPLADITKLEKRYNALIFDNSIAVLTKNNEFFFTSFVYRDKAYKLLEKLIGSSVEKCEPQQNISQHRRNR